MPPQIFTTDELKAMPLDTKGYIYLTVAEEYWRSLGHGTSKDIEEAGEYSLEDFVERFTYCEYGVTFIPIDSTYI